VADSCERGNEPSGFIKREDFLCICPCYQCVSQYCRSLTAAELSAVESNG
jgi:hypothetical protein